LITDGENVPYRRTSYKSIKACFAYTMFVTNNLDKRKKEIIHTWIAGQSSCTLIIPKPLAQEYGLDKPSHVVVEGKPEGILIKKLEI
jgi:hypothetical protein